ncbi:hypothetical protein AAG906_037507 [Vitis piasezkii]
MNVEGLYGYLKTLAALRQSSSFRGSSFDDFKKLGFPYFSSTLDPTEVEVWILKMEKFFDVIDCSEE